MSSVKSTHSIIGTLTGKRYVDEVLHPQVVPIYPTVGKNFLFQ